MSSMQGSVIGREARVLIGVPSHDEWNARFGMSLVAMILQSHHSKPKSYDSIFLDVDNNRGSLLPKQREDIVLRALEYDCTHILFLDSDQTFPPDTLYRLLDWKVPIVAANVATKSVPSSPTARKIGPSDSGVSLFTRPDSYGLERVWRVGTGIMLVQTWVFRDLARPWFTTAWKQKDGQLEFVGEDWCFCERVDAAGIQMYVDQDLSKEVGHIGSFEYDHRMIEAQLQIKEMRNAEEARKGTETRSKEEGPVREETGCLRVRDIEENRVEA